MDKGDNNILFEIGTHGTYKLSAVKSKVFTVKMKPDKHNFKFYSLRIL